MQHKICLKYKMHKKQYQNFFLVFLGVMAGATYSHSWLFCFLITYIFYLFIPRKKRTEAECFLPISEQEEQRAGLIKSVMISGGMSLLLFVSLLWCCYVENEYVLNPVAVKYSSFVVFNYFLLVSKGILLQENAANRGVTESWYLKNSCSGYYRGIYLVCALMHIAVSWYGIMLGSFLWVEKGQVIVFPVSDNIILAVFAIVLLVLYGIFMKFLVRTLTIGDYNGSVRENEVNENAN